jgi:hypothetical protein
MRRVIALAAVALTASLALAQPYYARGDFNGWAGTADPLADMGGGKWSYTVTGLTPGAAYEYKATVDDWSFNAPGSNARTTADGSGEITMNFFPNTSWADGWEPSAKPRLGWEDPGAHGWELIGAMNGWAGGDILADMGGGLYSGTFALPAGTHEFKFRMPGDWAHSTGDDLGNAAANNSVTVANNGDTWQFDLDLPNGRWRTTFIPEPTTLALLALGGLLGFRRR